MANLFDELQMGTVSRRKLLQLLSAGGSAAIAAAQTKGNPPKLSPANIGGGGRIERNFYREWIKTYTSPEFVEGANRLVALLDRLAQGMPPPQTAGLSDLFLTSSRYEYLFWEMSWTKATWPV